jgi:outer membrane protein assembly factor BamA
MMWRTILIFTALVLCASSVQAADSPKNIKPAVLELTPSPKERMSEEALPQKQKQVPPASVMEANGATIGKITIIAKDIFDENNPKENKALFRLVNKLHIKTRKDTIAELLLFRSGDKYSPQELADSERILRNLRFLYDARVRPISYKDNKVNVEVITTDVWTLGLSINYSRKGGENRNSFELRESNLLGYGKELRVRRSSNIDRVEKTLEYFDPNLASNHNQLTLAYSNNSDGLVKKFDLARPFISLDTRWAFDINHEFIQEEEKIYEQGEVVHRFDHTKKYFDFLIGFSRGLINNRTRRWTWGLSIHDDEFQANADSSPGYIVPNKRRLVYPWVGYEYVQNRFIKTRRLNFINRTEDLNLGKQYHLKIGWSDKSFNATSNSLIYEGNYTSSYKASEKHLFLEALDADGRLTEGHSDFLHLASNTRYYHHFTPSNAFYSSLDLEVQHNRNPDETQLWLGGDNGLRGYPIRIQSGDRKVLFTMEQRYYTDWHVLQLLYVGAAMFFDIGRAWSADTPSTPLTGFLKDAGFGLRISSSRAGKGQVLHMDFAFPLDADGISTVDKFQYIVSTEGTF